MDMTLVNTDGTWNVSDMKKCADSGCPNPTIGGCHCHCFEHTDRSRLACPRATNRRLLLSYDARRREWLRRRVAPQQI